MQFLHRKKRAMLGLVLMLTLPNCAGMMDLNDPLTDLPSQMTCGIFQPVTWSERDTDTTILQIKQHNAAWRAVCDLQITKN